MSRADSRNTAQTSTVTQLVTGAPMRMPAIGKAKGTISARPSALGEYAQGYVIIRASRLPQRAGSACPKVRAGPGGASGQERGPPMKYVIGAALAAIVFLAVLAGRDDIRRFRRMKRM
jgi:hypothetical protein